MQAPHEDARCRAPIEPMENLYDSLADGLHSFVGAPVLTWTEQPPVPVCRRSDGSRVIYIVHLFSGRRRENDCHHWVEVLQKTYFPDVEVILLSLDTAVCGQQGNLLEGEGLQVLLKMVSLGLITASLSGPLDHRVKRGRRRGTCRHRSSWRTYAGRVHYAPRPGPGGYRCLAFANFVNSIQGVP